MFILLEKMMRKKNEQNGKLMEKCEKEKGNKERIASCSFCPLFIRFLSFLAVFFLSFSASGSKENTSRIPSILGKPSTVNRKWDHRVPISSQFPPQSRHTSWFQASDPANGHYFWMPRSPSVSCPRAFYALNQTETYPTD